MRLLFSLLVLAGCQSNAPRVETFKYKISHDVSQRHTRNDNESWTPCLEDQYKVTHCF